MPQPPSTQPALGQRLRALRKKSKKSLFEVAYESGATPQALSMWERGEREPRARFIRALAETYGVSTDDLIGEKAAS